jgi:hypothetical protein
MVFPLLVSTIRRGLFQGRGDVGRYRTFIRGKSTGHLFRSHLAAWAYCAYHLNRGLSLRDIEVRRYRP